MFGLLLLRDRDRDTIGMVGMVYFETTVFPFISCKIKAQWKAGTDTRLDIASLF